MKTLILYATKHGATREIARRIADRMDGAALYDLKQGGVPALSEFDCVIVGSPVYAGTIRKEVKAFVSQNASALQGKRLGLFLSGMSADKEKEVFDANFPPDILQSAKTASNLGYIFNPANAGFMERFIMKAIAKQSGYLENIDDGKIEQFAEAVKHDEL